MQSIRNAILCHVRVATKNTTLKRLISNQTSSSSSSSTSTSTNDDGGDDHGIQTMKRVLGLVKKFDNVDPSKVSEKADFQKDLNLDSLDRVELVMAFEQEFSIEIPDQKADKLKSCADVAAYISSLASQK